MIEKYFPDLKKKNLTKVNGKDLNWINLKLRRLKWTKTKLEDWNEIWKKLECQFCILAKKVKHHRPRELVTIWTGETWT